MRYSRLLMALLGAFLLLMVTGCQEEKKNPIKTETISFTKEGELQVLRAGTDSVLADLDIEIAETDYETQTGLMYRESMEDTQAMWFVFETEAMHSFYMKNTLFPLDILFVNEELEIVTVAKNAQPLDEAGISSGVPVRYVLEIKAGLADKWGISEGDLIRYSRN
ncbi:DUF192 domain-containing protein [Robiginitalea sediminis]|uniref:DUF192 domain-containing protein n=1 Tax=Robiginitalea sediminis TaxID=1982593 RepID=UPI00374275C1